MISVLPVCEPSTYYRSALESLLQSQLPFGQLWCLIIENFKRILAFTSY